MDLRKQDTGGLKLHLALIIDFVLGHICWLIWERWEEK